MYKLKKHNLTGINEVLKVLAVLLFLNETMPDVPLSTLFLCRQLHIHCRDMRHFTEYWSKCQSIPLRTNSLYDRRLVYRAVRLRHRPLPRQRVQHLLVFFVCLFVCHCGRVPAFKKKKNSHLIESCHSPSVALLLWGSRQNGSFLFSGNCFSAKLLFCLFSVMLKVGQYCMRSGNEPKL